MSIIWACADWQMACNAATQPRARPPGESACRWGTQGVVPVSWSSLLVHGSTRVLSCAQWGAALLGMLWAADGSGMQLSWLWSVAAVVLLAWWGLLARQVLLGRSCLPGLVMWAQRNMPVLHAHRCFEA